MTTKTSKLKINIYISIYTLTGLIVSCMHDLEKSHGFFTLYKKKATKKKQFVPTLQGNEGEYPHSAHKEEKNESCKYQKS